MGHPSSTGRKARRRPAAGKRSCTKKTILHIINTGYQITGQVARSLADALQTEPQDNLQEPEDIAWRVAELAPGLALQAVADRWAKTIKSDEHTRRSIPVAMRRAVLMRDRCRCRGCREQETLILHHYKPVAQGGKNETGNLITLCPNCHSKVHDGRLEVERPKSVPLKSTQQHTAHKSSKRFR